MYVEAETIPEVAMAGCWFSIHATTLMMCNDEPTLMIVFHVSPETKIKIIYCNGIKFHMGYTVENYNAPQFLLLPMIPISF